MNKLSVIYLLLLSIAGTSAIDICAELKCGTTESKDACGRLYCPLPTTPPPSNATTTPDPPRNDSPANTIWPPPYPVDLPNDGYPLDYPFYESPPYIFPVDYPPYDPYLDFQPPFPDTFY